MKYDYSNNNFARGQLDHDRQGRYDLPIYQSGADLVQNFITNFKGNAIYRAGFEQQALYKNCVFVEFKFNNTQQYLCLFYANAVQFMAFASNGEFGFVQAGGGGDLTVTTPYSLSDLADIQYTQNGDYMIITNWNYEPQQLVRTSANAFTLSGFSRNADPFVLTNGSTKTISGITNATNAVFTATSHGFTAGQRVTIAGVVGMTAINGWTVYIQSVTTNTFTTDLNTSDTAVYVAYSSGGTAAPIATSDFPHACCFYKGRLYYAGTQSRPTGLFGSTAGSFNDFTQPATITDSTAIILIISDISQRIEWLYKADISLVAGSTDGIIALNGGAINTDITPSTITATLTTCLPCAPNVYPFKKDGLVFYMGIDGRNLYTFRYDLIQSLFLGEDCNTLNYNITYGGVTKMRWKKDRNDLIFFTTKNPNGNMIACNFFRAENIIGWTEHTTKGTFEDVAVILDNNSKPQLFVLALRPDGNYYIEQQVPYVEFAERVNFFTGTGNVTEDLESGVELVDDAAYNRLIAEQLKSCNYLDNAVMYNQLQIGNSLTYNPTAGTVTAASGVFSSGSVGHHIVYQTQTGYESGRFLITGYTSTTIVTVTALQAPTANTWANPWYLTFTTIGGLPYADGTVVSVVADGGYLDDYTCESGSIAISNEATNVWIGLGYQGIIKSFSLGFQIQGLTTQQTMKAVNQFGCRTVTTAGLEVGTSLYHMEPVQYLSPNDINYLPPIPMDGTTYIQFTDDNQRDKYFYAIQNLPLPCTITDIIVSAAYTVGV